MFDIKVKYPITREFSGISYIFEKSPAGILKSFDEQKNARRHLVGSAGLLQGYNKSLAKNTL